jgi:4-aminobutyrate aminotransferase-like enzyme
MEVLRSDRTLGQVARRGPLITHGHGCFVFDCASTKFIDLFASAGTLLLGHNNAEFADVLLSQCNLLAGNAYRNDIRDKYISNLSVHIPTNMDEAIFLSTGSEAVEAAIHLSQLVTGRLPILCIEGGYHGRTASARHISAAHFVGTNHPVLFPAITMPWRVLERSSNEDEFLSALERFLHSSKINGIESLAAVVVEPIQGTAGNRPIPIHVLKALSRVCSDNGCMYVIDECLTGGGRIGGLIFTSTASLNADFVILGKGLGNGMPISILITQQKYIDFAVRRYSVGFSTSFGGNLLSIAAANATLDIVMRENLPTHACNVGRLLFEKLSMLLMELGAPFKLQGTGLMIGFHIPRRGGDRNGFNAALFDTALQNGLYGVFQTEFVRINPSLIFDAALVEETVARFDAVLRPHLALE